MSILNQTRSVQYTGNGSAHTYALPFPYMSTSDLQITVDGVVLVANTDYEFTGTYPNESVHFIKWVIGVKNDNPPANGVAIDIQRYTPVVQPTEFRNQGQYFAKTHEGAFDRLCMQLQDLLKVTHEVQTQVVAAGNLIYDLALYANDLPNNAAVMGRWAISRTVAFPANLTGSKASAAVAATAQTILTLKKNGVSMGTFTWAAAGTVPTISSSAFTTVPGDIITIENQATQDATLAKISITMIGTRST